MKTKLSLISILIVAGLGFGSGLANAGGANVPGTYSTNICQPVSDCLPSANGKGNGHATGRPTAGSVGNADSKNPPGQAKKNGNNFDYSYYDGDSGYECDLNSGIAMGNPAHAGCYAGE